MLISPNPMQYSVNLGDRTPDYTGKMPVLHEERSHSTNRHSVCRNKVFGYPHLTIF
ncbi:hypothetical protein [Limnospira sp. PMC 1223.20]|uniref:hypothetical protein n=1 Tax=Limnospira sp. PMC 1223.20 TaxID=2981021 RepID=UPI0028E12D9E|nr:hypothetical protein [Limnospira sp. PMC 1223.20]MDT9267025.1 hypothetical protein [Limnospira sp. PMC 1223.20]